MARAGSRTAKTPPWWIVGLSHGLVGLLMGLVLNLLFVLALTARFGWVLSLEEWGTDFGMQFVSGWESPRASPKSAAERFGTPPNIVFLDIDDQSCIDLIGDAWACRMDMAGHIDEILIPIGDRLRTSGARLVVLDFMVTRREAEGEAESGATAAPDRLWAAWAEGDDPIVIAAVPVASVLSAEAAWLDWRRVIGGAPITGRMRYGVPIVRATSSANDMALRRFPLMIPVQEENRDYELPSVAFAAVLHSTPGIDRGTADCILYHDVLERALSRCLRQSIRLGRLVLPISDASRFRQAIADAGEARLGFTLPSLTPLPRRPNLDAQRDYEDTWDYYPLSAFIENRTINFGEELRNALVIVGSSMASAGDWHQTPLGYMTGAETIANQIVAIRTAAFQTQPTFWTRARDAVAASFWAALLMTLCWLLIAWILKRSKRSRKAYVLIVFVFVLGSILTFLVMLGRSIWIINPGEGAQAIDFLIPTIAVMLEGYFEGARAITAWAESFFEGLLIRLRARWPGSAG